MRFRPVALAALAALGTFALASPAGAGPLVADATDCADQAYEQPFLAFADPMTYVLAPAGTVEDAGPWSLSGSARPVSGNEPWSVHGAGETTSMALPDGSSATTAVMCVGLDHPTLRFFARNTGSPFSSLRVEVLFEDAAGSPQSLPIGTVARSGPGWAPTAPFPVTANLLALLPGALTPVAFRFTPQGPGGEWAVDDVYVDPRRSR